MLQVSGELSNNGEPMRRFMQTFVLAPQSPKKYYVHNDIFRYQVILLFQPCASVPDLSNADFFLLHFFISPELSFESLLFVQYGIHNTSYVDHHPALREGLGPRFEPETRTTRPSHLPMY